MLRLVLYHQHSAMSDKVNFIWCDNITVPYGLLLNKKIDRRCNAHFADVMWCRKHHQRTQAQVINPNPFLNRAYEYPPSLVSDTVPYDTLIADNQPSADAVFYSHSQQPPIVDDEHYDHIPDEPSPPPALTQQTLNGDDDQVYSRKLPSLADSNAWAVTMPSS